MWNKPTGESDKLQKQLDHFVDDLDHLNESPGGHAGEGGLGELDDNDMSWLDSEPEGIDQESMLPIDDYAADLFEGESSTPERPFKFLFGLFVGSTASVLALLWFFWPNTDGPLLQQPQLAQNEHRVMAAVVPDEPVGESHGQAGDTPPATEHVAAEEPEAVSVPVVAHILPVITPEKKPVPVVAAVKKEIPESSNPAATGVQEQKQLLTVDVSLGVIRDAPGRDGKVLARLKKGTVVLTLFRQGDWYRVRFPDGRQAWGYKTIFAAAPAAPDSESTTQPAAADAVVPAAVVVPAPMIKPEVAAAAEAVRSEPEPVKPLSAGSLSNIRPADVNPASQTHTQQRQVLTINVDLGVIRDKPGKQGRVVARLKRGTPVMTLALEGDWYRVLLEGREVWAHRSIF